MQTRAGQIYPLYAQAWLRFMKGPLVCFGGLPEEDACSRLLGSDNWDEQQPGKRVGSRPSGVCLSLFAGAWDGG